MDIYQELKRPRDDVIKKIYTGFLYILAALLISLNITLILNSCSGIKTVPVNSDIVPTILCPIADDITCQKCHAWKKVIADWHSPETQKIGKLEIILPESVDIDFNTGQVVILNPNASSKDWICENVFYQFDDGVYSVQVLYNLWSISTHPPMPPLALEDAVYLPHDDTGIDGRYWIYRNGVPVEVEQAEFDLYILSLQDGVKT